MRIISLIFIIALSLISCRTTQTSQPRILLASTTLYDTVKIASFNIQVFGQTKADKPAAENICEREKNSPDETTLRPLEGKISSYATVWNESYTGMIDNDKMVEKIIGLINSLVDEFLSDYRKVKSEEGAEQREAI